MDADRQLAAAIRRQSKQVAAGLYLIEAFALWIHQHVGRAVVRGGGPCLIEARRQAHHHVAAKILAGQFVAQRVANEVHPLRNGVGPHRQAELLREQVGDPILETFALAVRKRQVARIDARTKCGARFFRSDARAAKCKRNDNRTADEMAGHSFSSSTFGRVISPLDRPFRYAYRLSMLSITVLLDEKLTIPLSSRPSRTVLTKSSLLRVFRLSNSDGPTRPSWLAPWQRSQAAARHARKPFIVFA